jgi:hypothetical protein
MVEVVLPARTTPCTYQAINASEDEAPGPTKPPTDPGLLWVYATACDKCNRGKRQCVVDELGSVCAGCKARKYKCDHTGNLEARTKFIKRTRTKSELDDEVVVVATKGKSKRQADPVVRVKREKRA